MNLYFEQKRIDKAQKILELIEEAHDRIKLNKASISGFPGTFPKLRREYNHDIEISKMAIKRLESCYQKTLKDVR